MEPGTKARAASIVKIVRIKLVQLTAGVYQKNQSAIVFYDIIIK